MADPIMLRTTEKLNEFDLKFQQFSKQVNDLLSWVPEPFVDLIEPIQREHVNAEKRKSEFHHRLAKFFQEPGDATTLRAKGESWTNEVGNPIGTITGDIDMIRLRAYTEWSGPAAEAYKVVVPAQGAALSSLKGLAQQNRTSLDALANALDSFYLALDVALTLAIVGLTGAIAGAATVAGALPAIAGLLATLGAALGLITTIVMSMNTFLDIIESQQTALRQKLQDVADQWPRATHDLADASVRDGDRSGWQANG